MQIIGIGTDIEHIARFRKKNYENDKAFYNKVFSKAEIEYCLKKADPYASFTGKFCAKEAVVKALEKNNMFKMADIEIINKKQGQPEAFVNGKKLNCFLSISHTNDNAIAFCVAYK